MYTEIDHEMLLETLHPDYILTPRIKKHIEFLIEQNYKLSLALEDLTFKVSPHIYSLDGKAKAIHTGGQKELKRAFEVLDLPNPCSYR